MFPKTFLFLSKYVLLSIIIEGLIRVKILFCKFIESLKINEWKKFRLVFDYFLLVYRPKPKVVCIFKAT